MSIIKKMKKLNNIKELEDKVASEYPEKEIMGVIESVLHYDTQIKYLQSKEGKAIIVEAVGEIAYLEEMRKMASALKRRQAELKFLKELFG